MIDKKFTPVFDVSETTMGYENQNLENNLYTIDYVESNFLFFENDDYKIYILKMNPTEVKIEIQQWFFKQIELKNILNKKIIFINPTESVSDGFLDTHKKNENYLFVTPDRWQGIATFLYAKSQIDTVVDFIKSQKFNNIIEQNYKPFKLMFLVRRGHKRRYEFFKFLESKKNPSLFLSYKNAAMDAKQFKDESKHLNFYELDGIKFPYQSHEVIQPIEFHAAFDGYNFMNSCVCLLSMSKFNLVVESNYYEGALTEKSIYPFLSKSIPIFTNGKTHIEMLEKLGFYTFVDELGIRDILKKGIKYYQNSDNTNYFIEYFQILDKIVLGEFDYLLESHKDKIEYNYNLCMEIQKGKF